MKELLERLRGATGADRELDALIEAAFKIHPSTHPAWATNWQGQRVANRPALGRVSLGHDDGRLGMHWRAPDYTASLEAALGLAERLDLDGRDTLYDALENHASWRTDKPYAGQLALEVCITTLEALSGRPEAEDVAEDQSSGTNNNTPTQDGAEP